MKTEANISRLPSNGFCALPPGAAIRIINKTPVIEIAIPTKRFVDKDSLRNIIASTAVTMGIKLWIKAPTDAVV